MPFLPEDPAPTTYTKSSGTTAPDPVRTYAKSGQTLTQSRFLIAQPYVESNEQPSSSGAQKAIPGGGTAYSDGGTYSINPDEWVSDDDDGGEYDPDADLDADPDQDPGESVPAGLSTGAKVLIGAVALGGIFFIVRAMK